MTRDIDTHGAACWRALDAHARRMAREEHAYALGVIAQGGVARLWHARTGLRSLDSGAALHAFFVETRQAF